MSGPMQRLDRWRMPSGVMTEILCILGTVFAGVAAYRFRRRSRFWFRSLIAGSTATAFVLDMLQTSMPRKRRSRKLFETTLTELSAIAALGGGVAGGRVGRGDAGDQRSEASRDGRSAARAGAAA